MNRKIASPSNENAKLNKGLAKLTGKNRESCSLQEWSALREQFRLQVLYPGQFVAFRDAYEGNGETTRLLAREVLHHSKSLNSVQTFVSKLPEDVQRGIFIDYVESTK